MNDVLKNIPGIDVFQSGPKGQSTSILLEDQSLTIH